MNPKSVVSKQKCLDYIKKLTIYGHFSILSRHICLKMSRLQSSRKCRIQRIFMPIFAFVRLKFPSEDSHLRSIATGRPNWTSKTYRGLPKFLLSVEIDTQDVKKLSKSPPTFNELYDVWPAYLLEIRYLCWLSFKDVPLSACSSFIDIGVKRRGTLLMAAWSLCVFVTHAELINWCLYNWTFFCDTRKYSVKLYEVIIIFKYSRLKILNYYFAKNVCRLKTPQHFRELPSEIK